MPELKGWWSKQISPGLSFVILIVFTLSILLIGVFFVREYVGVWTQINEIKQKVEYYPEKPSGFGKIFIPDSK